LSWQSHYLLWTLWIFFCCIKCIVEICWFHFHSPFLLLVLHFFSYAFFFLALFSYVNILLLFVTLQVSTICCQLVFFQSRFGYAHGQWVVFFSHTIDGDGVHCPWITCVHVKIYLKTYCCIIGWCCNNKIAIFEVNQPIINLCDFCLFPWKSFNPRIITILVVSFVHLHFSFQTIFFFLFLCFLFVFLMFCRWQSYGFDWLLL
jgi:hypothetical protein